MEYGTYSSFNVYTIYTYVMSTSYGRQKTSVSELGRKKRGKDREKERGKGEKKA